MSPLEIVRLTMVIAHFVGLAAVIGPFLLQLQTREGFRLRAMRLGAIVQIVSGNLLIASRRLQGMEVTDEKMIAKMAIAVIVLVAVIVATLIQRRARKVGIPDRRVRPWMLTAGGLAILNIGVAVAWT